MVISRVISALNGVTLIITLLITNLLSPLPLQVVVKVYGLKVGVGAGGFQDQGTSARRVSGDVNVKPRTLNPVRAHGSGFHAQR